jgi:hypothetical protein
MGVFKFINFPVFLISLAIGLFAVYITMPDKRKIFVYPTPDNYDILQYRDKADACFSFSEKQVDCPKDESKISKIPAQA